MKKKIIRIRMNEGENYNILKNIIEEPYRFIYLGDLRENILMNLLEITTCLRLKSSIDSISCYSFGLISKKNWIKNILKKHNDKYLSEFSTELFRHFCKSGELEPELEDVSWVKGILSSDKLGNPSKHAYWLYVDFVNHFDHIWLKSIFEGDVSGEPYYYAFLLVERGTFSKEWYKKILERSFSRDFDVTQIDGRVSIASRCVSSGFYSKEWYEEITGRKY